MVGFGLGGTLLVQFGGALLVISDSKSCPKKTLIFRNEKSGHAHDVRSLRSINDDPIPY